MKAEIFCENSSLRLKQSELESIVIFWVVTPENLAGGCQYFEGIHRLNLQDEL